MADRPLLLSGLNDGAHLMRCRTRLAVTTAILALSMPAAPAGDLTAFNASVEAVAVHYRLAASYLRTGNADLGGLEIDYARRSWLKVIELSRMKTPDAFEDNPLFASTLTQVSDHFERASIQSDSGDLAEAAKQMMSIRAALNSLRRTSGLYLLADCILDANKAMDTLFAYETTPPDWNEEFVGAAIQSRAAAYEYALRQCDQMVAAPVKNDPEFRRLVDGAVASLSLIPKAIRDRDSSLLHRVLVEMRSFDNLLFVRFG